MNHYIQLKSIRVEEESLIFEFASSLNVFRRFDFFVWYSKKLDRPQDSILAIPFAAIMAPVAWATGADLLLPCLDANYIQSLERCCLYWEKCFQEKWSFNGRLMTHPVKNQNSPTSKYGMLFSGGLDSMVSYIKNKSLQPELFVVIGADFPSSKRSFAQLCRENLFNRFSKEQNAELTYIDTNLDQILNLKRLKPYSSNWYGAVSHGLMLTGLVAPVAHSYLKTLIMASCSHKPDLEYPCGSDPDVIRNVQWENTKVSADLYEINRAQKIARYLKNEEKLWPFLRVCWSQYEEFNCSACEKCLRTICELLLNNIDPNMANFRVTDATLPGLKRKLQREFNLFFRGNEMILNFWRAIQESIALDEIQDLYGSKEFFLWFSGFKKLKEKRSKRLRAFLTFIFEMRDALSHWKNAFSLNYRYILTGR